MFVKGEALWAIVIDLETSDPSLRTLGIRAGRPIIVLFLWILSMAVENVFSIVNFDSIEGATSGNCSTAARSRRY